MNGGSVDVSIRSATSADDARLLQIAVRCGLNLNPERERTLPHARLLVAQHVSTTGSGGADADSTMGFAVVWLLGQQAELVDIGVEPAFRRRHVGQALLHEAIATVVREKVQRFFLEVRAGNAAARSLYEAAGFEAYGARARYYADGEDALLYCLTLDQAG